MRIPYKIPDSVLWFLVPLPSGRSSFTSKAFHLPKILAMNLVLVLSLQSPIQAAPNPSSEIPTEGFAGNHYLSLWTKSPFAIATPEAAAVTQDYQLTGLAQFDGVFYASLVDKQNQEHFLLTSAKPVRNLSLVSISHGRNGGSAVILRNGERLTLQEENAAPSLAPVLPPVPGQQNGVLILPVPGNPSAGGVRSQPPAFPPSVRLHRPPVHVPPAPQ